MDCIIESLPSSFFLFSSFFLSFILINSFWCPSKPNFLVGSASHPLLRGRGRVVSACVCRLVKRSQAVVCML